MRELLCDEPAEREAEHVRLLVAELVEQFGGKLRERGDRQRPQLRRRAARARRVEDDGPRHLRKSLLRRQPGVDAAADAVDHQQRPSVAALADEHVDAARANERLARDCACSCCSHRLFPVMPH